MAGIWCFHDAPTFARRWMVVTIVAVGWCVFVPGARAAGSPPVCNEMSSMQYRQGVENIFAVDCTDPEGDRMYGEIVGGPYTVGSGPAKGLGPEESPPYRPRFSFTPTCENGNEIVEFRAFDEPGNYSKTVTVGLTRSGSGCRGDGPESDDPPADDITASPSVFSGRKGFLQGTFSGDPASTVFRPATLTVWLPKGVTFPRPGQKACSEQQARNLESIRGCPKLAGGKLKDNRYTAWFAYLGPKSNGKHRVWLKVREEDPEEGYVLSGLGTGVIEKTSGRFATRVVLNLGTLGIRTSLMEYDIRPFRAAGPCPKGGWRYRVQLKTPEGTSDRTGRGSCGK